MTVQIANVELTYSFDQWRITTNQIIEALKNDVVIKTPEGGVEEVNYSDSVQVTATPISTSSTDTVTLATADVNKINNFKVGQKVRIYGAKLSSDDNYVDIETPSGTNALTAQVIGFSSLSKNDTLSYKFAQFDYLNGKISSCWPTAVTVNVNKNYFNDTNNVRLTINRTNTNYGILIYRATSSSPYNLIAVLGPKELSGTTCTWIDYFDYDFVPWSKKTSNNEFGIDSGLIHFPLTAPASPSYGWVDNEISFVDPTLKRLKFKNNCVFVSSVTVSHNDTEYLQNLINTNVSSGNKTLRLGPKVYIVEGLTVPSNFALVGTGNITTLKKLSWSSNYTTGNKLIKGSSSSTNSFNIFDLIIDGNMQNQYRLSENADTYSNYLVDLNGDGFRYQNLKVVNSVGGGINASFCNNVSVISSLFVDGNTTDRYEYSPLDINSSADVVLTSNVFKNYSGAVEASVVSAGSAVGNIIKNCGSGLVVYGSTNFVSSPNILMGPANEFLPTPDILNSSYDSVNIKLERSTNYNSDNYTYQENGNVVDLTANRSSIYHRIDKLQKVDSLETLYGSEILISGSAPIQPVLGTDLANGVFRFTISSQNVDVLLDTYAYTTLKAANPNHVGLVYRSILTEYVPSGTVDTVSSPTSYNISRAFNANSSGVNNLTDTIKIDNTNNSYFDVGDLVYYTNTLGDSTSAIGGLTLNTKYYVTFANNTDIALSSTYNGANVNINETRTTAGSHSIKKTAYRIKLQNESNISIGARVRFLNHNGSIGTGSFDNQIGTIVSYNNDTHLCKIIYDPTINISSPGSGGNITIENSFVLAKGRIL